MSWNNEYNLGVRPAEGEMWGAGIAYVVLPSDVERDVYVRECFKTATVSIYSEFNGYINRVPVDHYTLNHIQFPDKENEFGTAVAYLLDPIHKRPIIVGCYYKEDDLADLKENQFKIRRELNGNVVEVAGSPEEKFLSLNVRSDKGGKLNINVRSDAGNGKLNVEVMGDVTIQSTSGTTLQQAKNFTSRTSSEADEDQFSEIQQTPEANTLTADNTNINTDLLTINGGEENFILGQKLKTFLTDLIKEIAAATVTTSIGQMPLINAQKIAAYTEKIDEFLSKEAFLDK